MDPNLIDDTKDTVSMFDLGTRIVSLPTLKSMVPTITLCKDSGSLVRTVI